MKRMAFTGLILAVLFAATAGATTSTWNKQAAGMYDWTTPANWDTGDVPDGTDHVAIVPGPASGTGVITINLGGPIVLGTLEMMRIGGGVYTIAPNGGSLTFATAAGPATLGQISSVNNNDVISAPITLLTDLVIRANTSSFRYGFDSMLELSGPIDGAGGILKQGNRRLALSNTPNSFSGPLAVEHGWVSAGAMGALGASATPIVMGADGRLGGLMWDGGDAAPFTRAIELAGAGARLMPMANLRLENAITGTGSLIVFRGANTVHFDHAADNDYDGPTLVTSGRLTANVNHRVIPGDVWVVNGGVLTLAHSANVGGRVRAISHSLPTPGLTQVSRVIVTDDFVPDFTPDSTGIFEWTGDSGAIVNAALAAGPLGNGYMAYGSSGAASSYTGATLAPNADDVYRFVAQIADLTLSEPNVLTGDRSVIVSTVRNAQTAPNYGIVLPQANDFTGALVLHPGAYVNGTAQTTEGKGPFGHADGPVHIAGGHLRLAGVVNGKAAAKGDLTIRGKARVSMDSFFEPHRPAHLSFATLTRLNQATLGVWGQRGRLGGSETLKIVSDPPANDARGMVAPWMVAEMGVSFLAYDPAIGFTNAPFTADSLAAAGPTDIVTTPGGAVIETKPVHAIRTEGALTSAGDGDVLSITSGGLISVLPANHTANINFGAAEGIIYLAGAGTAVHTFSGAIRGQNGLTIGAVTRSLPGMLRVELTPSAPWHDLKGTLTINAGIVGVNSNVLAGLERIVLGSGRQIDSNNQFGSVLGVVSGGATIPAAVEIILNDEGGAFRGNGNFNLEVDGRIRGAGGLWMMSGGNLNYIYINHPDNDYSGGTYVLGTRNFVRENGKLGTGDVIVEGELRLFGTDNIDDNARLILCEGGNSGQSGVWLTAAGQTIGSLEGSGRIFLWNTGACVLTLGGNDASTDFFGEIGDQAFSGQASHATYTGTVIKTGTGAFTLWGDGMYLGGTTVEGGSFVLHGYLAGEARVESGGALKGTGLVDANLTLTGGTVQPGTDDAVGTLTVSGNATADADAAMVVNLGPGGANSVLAVGGTASLDGSLSVATVDGYKPPVGGSWTILTSEGGVSGGFTSVPADYMVTVLSDRVVLNRPPRGTLLLVR